jgi:photosynthetic reaction center cytochrome c subunit
MNSLRSLIVAVVPAAVLLAACERPPVEVVQRGYRGTGMQQVFNPRTAAEREAIHKAPAVEPAAAAGGEPVTSVYKNVRVLKDQNLAEFTRTMVAMTNWVAPKEGCNYCHVAGNFESDDIYTKIVARRMIEMTRHINAGWKNHVGDTGVNCHTCHRGKPVPDGVWFADAAGVADRGYAGARYAQNAPAKSVGLTSLPYDPFSVYLQGKGEVRVAAKTALPTGPGATLQHTEWTYGLMMHMSDALGVNCTYCHNTRSFAPWEASTPQRSSAWHGIRMVRDLNVTYLDPLKSAFPPARLGPAGDAPKLNCTTCHQGLFKPLNGANMIAAHPELSGAARPVQASAAPAAAPPSGTLGRVLFAVGRKDLAAEAMQVIEAAARVLKDNAAVKVDLSGFADRSGNAQSNLELARDRAFAVRDALKTAGVAADRINLKKPEFVIGGAEADSRRVEIHVTP